MTQNTVIFFVALLTACNTDLWVDDLGEAAVVGTDDTAPGRPIGVVWDGGVFECVVDEGDSEARIVDLIVALDTSANMDSEALMVQEALNGLFAQLTASGIDLRIVLISAMSPSDAKDDKNGVCIDAPLGSGVCPEDSRSPEFVHVPDPIGSRNALSIILSSYEKWKGNVRNGSSLHFLVVSDDDADIDAAMFQERLGKLAPPVDEFVFHAIASDTDKNSACDADPPGACCEYAAKEGVVYKELVQLTGGYLADLCLQAFSEAFDALALSIAIKSCGQVV